MKRRYQMYYCDCFCCTYLWFRVIFQWSFKYSRNEWKILFL